MCEAREFVELRWPVLVGYLEPLVQGLEQPERVFYEEEMIQCLSRSIQALKRVTRVQARPLEWLGALLAKNGGRLSFLFEYLNLIIKHEHSQLRGSPLLQHVVQVACRVVQSPDLHYSELAEGYMLLHLLLKLFPEMFSEEGCRGLLEASVLGHIERG